MAATKTSAKKVTAKPAAKNADLVKMDICKEIVRDAFADKNNLQPRATAVALFQSDKRLQMEKTTASTYYGLVMKAFREAEQADAIAAAEEGKNVYSAVKVNSENVITSLGVFLTQKGAKAFNEEFRHDGVVPGVAEIGEVMPEGTYTPRVRAKKEAAPAKKATAGKKVVGSKRKVA